MTINAVLFDGAGPGRNAYVITNDDGRIVISIPGDPERAGFLTLKAWDAYTGPANGGPEVYIARYAAEALGVTRVEIDPELLTGGREGEVY